MKKKNQTKNEEKLKQFFLKIKKLTLSFIKNMVFQASSSHLRMARRGGSTIVTRETRVAPIQNNNNKILAKSYLKHEIITV